MDDISTQTLVICCNTPTQTESNTSFSSTQTETPTVAWATSQTIDPALANDSTQTECVTLGYKSTQTENMSPDNLNLNNNHTSNSVRYISEGSNHIKDLNNLRNISVNTDSLDKNLMCTGNMEKEFGALNNTPRVIDQKEFDHNSNALIGDMNKDSKHINSDAAYPIGVVDVSDVTKQCQDGTYRTEDEMDKTYRTIDDVRQKESEDCKDGAYRIVDNTKQKKAAVKMEGRFGILDDARQEGLEEYKNGTCGILNDTRWTRQEDSNGSDDDVILVLPDRLGTSGKPDVVVDNEEVPDTSDLLKTHENPNSGKNFFSARSATDGHSFIGDAVRNGDRWVGDSDRPCGSHQQWGSSTGGDQNLIPVTDTANLNSVSNPANQFSVLNATKLISVPNASSLSSVPTTGKQPSLPNAVNLISVQNASSLSSVPNASSLCSVPNASSLSSVPNASSLCSVPNVSSLSSVQNASSLRSVPNASSLSSVPNPGSLLTVTSLRQISNTEKHSTSQLHQYISPVTGLPVLNPEIIQNDKQSRNYTQSFSAVSFCDGSTTGIVSNITGDVHCEQDTKTTNTETSSVGLSSSAKRPKACSSKADKNPLLFHFSPSPKRAKVSIGEAQADHSSFGFMQSTKIGKGTVRETDTQQSSFGILPSPKKAKENEDAHPSPFGLSPSPRMTGVSKARSDEQSGMNEGRSKQPDISEAAQSSDQSGTTPKADLKKPSSGEVNKTSSSADANEPSSSTAPTTKNMGLYLIYVCYLKTR